MNTSLLSLLVFLAAFAVVVLIHEIGHFLAARLVGVEVEEFGVGLPPRLARLFRWKGTDFTLNWLPIGGFVRPKGENDPAVKGGLAAASAWARLAVLLAGPMMNLLLGIAVFSMVFYNLGVPDYTKVQIGEVLGGSPAQQAGLAAKDLVISVNGVAVTSPDQLHQIIYSNLDQPLSIVVQRGQQEITLTAVPASSRSQSGAALGISMGPALVRTGSVPQAIRYGAVAVYSQARALVLLPAQLIRGQISPEEGRFVGLKGIYDMFGQAVSRDVQSRETPVQPSGGAASAETPTYFTLTLAGILTISLGVLNLFPFPALDGGRIIFLVPEIFFRKRVPQHWENRVHAIGMMVLLLFMLYVNIMDFVHPIAASLP